MASRNLVRSRLAQALIESGKSPEAWGEEHGISGMTIRRLLDPEVRLAPHLQTRMLLAKALGESPNDLWPPIAVRKRPREKSVA